MPERPNLTAFPVDDLAEWLRRRVRAQEASPPVAMARGERPEDFVIDLYASAAEEFRTRLRDAVIKVFDWLARHGDLRTSPDAEALASMAAIVRHHRMQEASVVMRRIAEHGLIVGPSEIEAAAERELLAALATVQPVGVFRDHWLQLWKHAISHKDPFWGALAIAGLRRSDPARAIELLPDVVRHAPPPDRFPLGDILWAFKADPNVSKTDLARELGQLPQPERDLCRDVLRSAGATPDEIAEVVGQPELEPASETDPIQGVANPATQIDEAERELKRVLSQRREPPSRFIATLRQIYAAVGHDPPNPDLTVRAAVLLGACFLALNDGALEFDQLAAGLPNDIVRAQVRRNAREFIRNNRPDSFDLTPPHRVLVGVG